MLKKILLGLGVLVVLAVAAVAVWFYVLHPKMRPAQDLRAEATPAALERGRYLATITGCIACHSPIDESRPGDFPVEERLLAGRVFPGDENFPEIRAGNLTPDPETGLGGWTDGEIVRAIREGIAKDGRVLFPMMPYTSFRELPDGDVLAIVAYLRTVPPVRNPVAATDVPFPVSMFVRMAPRPVETPPPAWPTDPVARGHLLLKLSSCGDCHTPREKGHPVEGMELAGGTPFVGPWGTVYASNITSDRAAGIGALTDDDLRRALRDGRRKDGRLLWVMPWSATASYTDQDLDAVIAALRTIPANGNLVPPAKLNEQATKVSAAAADGE